MKVMFTIDNYAAHYYIRLGLRRALEAIGYTVYFWDINQKPVFDAFDEFEPDIFFGQTFTLNDAIIKCIAERPQIRVVMKASDWGKFNNEVNIKEYPVLLVQEKEKSNMLKLQRITGKPDILYIHYHPDWIEYTHGEWSAKGFKVISLLNAADVFEFTNGQRKPEFACDIAFMGGYWPYKAKILDKWLIPLCKPDTKYHIKLYGNSPWPVMQYCGFLPSQYTKDALKSATICPNLHEPHSHTYGWDIVERPFKLLSNQCFVISDYVEGLQKLFNNDELLTATNPTDFCGMIEHYITNPNLREEYIHRGYCKVMHQHTYFDRIAQLLQELDIDDWTKVDSTKLHITGQLGLKSWVS